MNPLRKQELYTIPSLSSSTSVAMYIVRFTRVSGRPISMAVNASVGILGEKFISVIILKGVDDRASVST